MRQKWFYILLLIIYILFLSKDGILYLVKNKEVDLNNLKEAYYEKEYNDLKKVVDIKDQEYNIYYGKLILRDIYGFYDKITIKFYILFTIYLF